MGLIAAAVGSAGGVLADQWKEYFYCDAMPDNVLAVKGRKRTSGRSSNRYGSDNIISSGSVIAVAEGQCMLILEQGKVVEVCAQPGEFVYDASTEPSIFSGGLNEESIKNVFKQVGKRFTFGGEAPKTQSVYYINTREIVGNKYGTAQSIPFRVVDEKAGFDMDVNIRCFGEYSYRITNPLLFFTNLCGNIQDSYDRSAIDPQMKSELLSALQPSFGKLSEQGIRYSSLTMHTMEIADALNEILSAKWKDLRGMEIVSFGVSSVKANEDDEKMLKRMQAFSNPAFAAANMMGARADAMEMAASNQTAGPAMAFMGMNMAANGGMGSGGNQVDLAAMYQMGAQQRQMEQAQKAAAQQAAAQQAAQQPPKDSWTCSCGSVNTGLFCSQCGSKKPVPKPADSWDCSCGNTGITGKFCPECGSPRPAPAKDGWTCTCGTVNKGRFCSECGKKKPEGTPKYRCDKCGWEPADPTKPPKFCPECGDPFNDGDIYGTV